MFLPCGSVATTASGFSAFTMSVFKLSVGSGEQTMEHSTSKSRQVLFVARVNNMSITCQLFVAHVKSVVENTIPCESNHFVLSCIVVSLH